MGNKKETTETIKDKLEHLTIGASFQDNYRRKYRPGEIGVFTIDKGFDNLKSDDIKSKQLFYMKPTEPIKRKRARCVSLSKK